MKKPLDRKTMALTYALWDNENTTKLQNKDDLSRYYSKAVGLKYWLERHGIKLKIKVDGATRNSIKSNPEK